MRILHPPVVYVSEAVRKDEAAAARAERLLSRVECEDVRTVSDEELDAVIEESGWRGNRRLSGRQRHGDPPMVLDMTRFAPADWPEGEPLPRRYRNPLLGIWHRRDGADILRRDGVVCQSGFGIHSGRGCLFKCDYCMFEDVLALSMNIEELVERIDPVVRAAEGPTLWKWDNSTDTLCFEPELGAARLLVEYFAQFEDQFLMTYSKSDNVDCLLDLDHRGQTICCWTLNAATQSRLIEREAATMEERIEAAHRCEQAGYTVRFRFSAICPVKGWRRENREMLDLLFARTHPDIITLETLSRMYDPRMFHNVMDASLFEERFVQAIEAGAEEMAGKIWGPLPDDAREEIYRFLIAEIRARSPQTPISLCQEPPHMWKRLSDVLRMSPNHYVCTCARDSVPGHELLAGL